MKVKVDGKDSHMGYHETQSALEAGANVQVLTGHEIAQQGDPYVAGVAPVQNSGEPVQMIPSTPKDAGVAAVVQPPIAPTQAQPDLAAGGPTHRLVAGSTQTRAAETRPGEGGRPAGTSGHKSHK
jgi:hypothetical protein